MRTKTLLLTILGLLLCVATGLAQNTLCIHQKNGAVVSYGFAEKPVVTYVGENLHVSTDKVSIDYPLSELEKLTFTDSESSIGQLRVEHPSTEVLIYRMDGTLISRMEATEGVPAFDTRHLPTGSYIIKHGDVTTKLNKR